MLKHILVPLDGTPLAEMALDALKTMLPPQAKITLVSAVPSAETLPTVTLLGGDDATLPLDHYLDHVAQRLRLEGFQAEVEIRVGEAADVIATVAVTLGVEMIAMCSHGRAGLERLLFGSVTENLLTLAPCPVLVIPNRVREKAEEPALETHDALELKPGLAS